MIRLVSPIECRKVTDMHLDYFTFDCVSWLSDVKNRAYQDGPNVGFAEFKSIGHYHVHFCFDEARGRKAISLANAMLDSLYEDTSYKSVVAIVCKDNRKAIWVVRQMGFIYLEDIVTKNGPSEMFYKTRN